MQLVARPVQFGNSKLEVEVGRGKKGKSAWAGTPITLRSDKGQSSNEAEDRKGYF